MTTDEVKRVLGAFPPQHDVPRAIRAVIAGMRLEMLGAVTGPPNAVSEREREYWAGGLEAMNQLQERLSACWARSLQPVEPDPEPATPRKRGPAPAAG